MTIIETMVAMTRAKTRNDGMLIALTRVRREVLYIERGNIVDNDELAVSES